MCMRNAHLKFFSLSKGMEFLIQAVALRHQGSITGAQLLFAFWMVVWAPVAEELFYRGYLYGVCKAGYAWPGARLVASVFFGLRHVTHFFYMWPDTVSV